MIAFIKSILLSFMLNAFIIDSFVKAVGLLFNLVKTKKISIKSNSAISNGVMDFLNFMRFILILNLFLSQFGKGIRHGRVGYFFLFLRRAFVAARAVFFAACCRIIIKAHGEGNAFAFGIHF